MPIVFRVIELWFYFGRFVHNCGGRCFTAFDDILNGLKIPPHTTCNIVTLSAFIKLNAKH